MLPLQQPPAEIRNVSLRPHEWLSYEQARKAAELNHRVLLILLASNDDEFQFAHTALSHPPGIDIFQYAEVWLATSTDPDVTQILKLLPRNRKDLNRPFAAVLDPIKPQVMCAEQIPDWSSVDKKSYQDRLATERMRIEAARKNAGPGKGIVAVWLTASRKSENHYCNLLSGLGSLTLSTYHLPIPALLLNS